MKRFFKHKQTVKDCKIYQMLSAHARGRHFSFHTPGHKVGKWDITELSFSDNLACPRGCIAEAETDITNILGSQQSFILTDGSTSGILSMLYCAKLRGIKTVAVCEGTHKSVFNGCWTLGLTPLVYPQKRIEKIPKIHTMSEMKSDFSEILREADALFITSPNYYGDVADWTEIRKYCDETGKALLVDGAHGGHLHYDKTAHAGAYADLWVDGVHKNLPAFTQGAVVSARTAEWAEVLGKAVDIFRTTSPSYPIMASVEYAVKYPRNEELEKVVRSWAQPRVKIGKDWTKVCALFGEQAFEVEKELEQMGIYPEFCDGNVVMFYLSPATTKKSFSYLVKKLNVLFEKYPYTEDKSVERVHAPLVFGENTEKEWVDLEKTVGRVCAGACGLFPPCTPLFSIGERITEEKLQKLLRANNVFGVKDGKILVVKE